MTDRTRGSNEDQALSALLDDELPPDEAERLRQRLAREPALAERLDELAGSDAALRQAYRDVVDEPLPQAVLDLLRRSESGDSAAPSAAAADDDTRVVALGSSRGAPMRWFSLPAAAAAALALVVGVLVGQLVDTGQAPPSTGLVAGLGPVEPATALYEILQSAPSAESHTLGASFTATPRLTFRTQGGDYCRQVDVTSPQGTTETLACRRAGEWHLEVASFTAPAGENGAFRPAAGASTPVRASVDARMVGAPLDAATERTLIANDWSAQP